MTTDKLPVMLSITEASAQTHVSAKLLRQLIHTDTIVYVRTGRKYLINEASLRDYLNGKRNNINGGDTNGGPSHDI